MPRPLAPTVTLRPLPAAATVCARELPWQAGARCAAWAFTPVAG